MMGFRVLLGVVFAASLASAQSIVDFDPAGSLATFNFRESLADESGNGYVLAAEAGEGAFADIAPGVPALVVGAASRFMLPAVESALVLSGDMTAHVVVQLETRPTAETHLLVMGSNGTDSNADNNTTYQLSVAPGSAPALLPRWFSEHGGGVNDPAAGSAATAITVGVPFLVSGVRDDGFVQLYVNGRPSGAPTSLATPTGGSLGRLGVGSAMGGTGGVVKLIKGVQIFGFAQSAAEVEAVFEAVFPSAASTAFLPAQPGGSALHSHNDYEQDAPLTDALGTTPPYASIEVDLFLQSGELRVAHSSSETVPGRTLDSLYLAPLQAMDSELHPAALVIDLKDTGATANAAFAEVVDRLAAHSTFSDGHLPVYMTGTRPSSPASHPAWVTFSALYGSVGLTDPAVSQINVDWAAMFGHYGWNGEGEAPRGLADQLVIIAKACHAAGKALRVYGTPATEGVWRALHRAGADWIAPGAGDDLDALATWFAAL